MIQHKQNVALCGATPQDFIQLLQEVFFIQLLHDQQYKWLKIDPAAEDQKSADSEEEEVNATLWKGSVLPLQHKLYVETHIFTYKQGDYM